VKLDFSAATCLDDARLVEMDVRLDQTGTDEPPARIVGFGGVGQSAFDRDDLAAGNAEVQGLSDRPIGEAGITNDQVHVISSDVSSIRGHLLPGRTRQSRSDLQ